MKNYYWKPTDRQNTQRQESLAAQAKAREGNYPTSPHEWPPTKVLAEKDQRIAELEEEGERLRTALSDIVVDAIDMGHDYDVRYDSIEAARAVLDGEKDGDNESRNRLEKDIKGFV